MSEREGEHRQLQILRRKHDESNTMLAIVMAGIAALFIVGIVAAYNYASSTTRGGAPQPATASAPATRTAPETTGAKPPEPQKVVPDVSRRPQ
jgi:hypothetical protein